MSGRELTQGEVDALPDGTLVDVTWPGRAPMRLRTRRRPDGAVWGVTPLHGYPAGPLRPLGTALVVVRIVEESTGSAAERAWSTRATAVPRSITVPG